MLFAHLAAAALRSRGPVGSVCPTIPAAYAFTTVLSAHAFLTVPSTYRVPIKLPAPTKPPHMRLRRSLANVPVRALRMCGPVPVGPGDDSGTFPRTPLRAQGPDGAVRAHCRPRQTSPRASPVEVFAENSMRGVSPESHETHAACPQ